MELTSQQFESLIQNLFAQMGLETRQTRASRDGGVDCVAYDNRPIFAEVVRAWVETMDRDFGSTEPTSAKQEAAYAQWFDQMAQRREGRRARLAEATASVPPPLWFVLGVSASAIIAYMCLQADRREGRLIQAAPIGLVAAVAAAGLLVVVLLDHPYADWSGSIKPTEMRSTLSLIDDGHPVPCNERGNPT